MKLLNWNIQRIKVTSLKGLSETLLSIDEVQPDALTLQEVGDQVSEALVAALEARGFSCALSDESVLANRHRVLVAIQGSHLKKRPHVFVHPRFPRAIVGMEAHVGAQRLMLISFHVPNGANQGWRKVDCLNALADLALSQGSGETMLLAGDANEPAAYRANGSAIPYSSPKERLRFDEDGRVRSTSKPWKDKRGESRPARQWYEAVERVFPSGPNRMFAELCLPYHLVPNAEPSHRSRGIAKPIDHLLCIGSAPKVMRLEYLHHLRNSFKTGAPSDHSALVAELAP